MAILGIQYFSIAVKKERAHGLSIPCPVLQRHNDFRDTATLRLSHIISTWHPPMVTLNVHSSRRIAHER